MTETSPRRRFAGWCVALGLVAAMDTTLAAATEPADAAMDRQAAASALIADGFPDLVAGAGQLEREAGLLLVGVDAMSERLRVWRKLDDV